MGYKFLNVNPSNKIVGDCVVRAISLALNRSWDSVYIDLSILGFFEKDVFTSNAVWSLYLKQNGFRKYAIPDTCPDCYTIRDFAMDHPEGTYILSTGQHTVCVIDGTYYDTWLSGDEQPIFYFER